VLPDPLIDVNTIHIPPGGTVVLYTDGLLDGRDDIGDSFGRNRLKSHLSKLTGQPGQMVCSQLLSAVMTHQDNCPQDDDITIVALHSQVQPAE
jgi:serine phosphatase RsbU (regulator of sigma subunit)